MLQLESLIHPNEGAISGLIPGHTWDLAFVGSTHDERGEKAVEFVRTRSAEVEVAYFNREKSSLYLNDSYYPIPELIDRLSECTTFLLDATTLGVAELLTLIRIFKKAQRTHFDILYIEPVEYANDVGPLAAKRRFTLSCNRRFQAIPGFTLELTAYKTPGRVIFFLGFEGERLQQALEQNAIENWEKTAVFGVPAYAAGWEINAFANNVVQLSENNFASVEYCSANSVFLAYQLLCHHHKVQPDPTVSPTIVVPLGTKAAQYCMCAISLLPKLLRRVWCVV